MTKAANITIFGVLVKAIPMYVVAYRWLIDTCLKHIVGLEAPALIGSDVMCLERNRAGPKTNMNRTETKFHVSFPC